MNLKGTLTRAAIPLAALTVLGAAGGAQAQGALEEIVVTAQKRDQSLQDVSVAVTAVSGDEIKALGITDAFRLEILAPGLHLGMSGADPRPALRGARTQQVEANDVAVSFYTDGLYRPRHGQALAGFVDVDRVEVLRGPQGTLFGRNSFGGLIHVISNRPDPSATDYGFAVSGGDYALAGLDGFFNAPLSDNSAVRVALKTETRDPFVENLTLGDDGGLKDSDMTYFRGQLSFAPSDTLDLLLRVESWQDDSNGNGHFGYYVEGIPVNLSSGLTNGVSGTMRPRIGRSDECAGTCGRYGAGFDFMATPGPDTVAQTTGDPYKIEQDTAPARDLSDLTLAGELNWSTDFADLKATIAYMDYEEYRWADCDMSAYLTASCGNDITSETNMQEFQLTSNSDGPLEWVVGVFLLQEDLTNAFLWEDHASTVDNTPVSPPDINMHAGWTLQIRVDTSSTAGYGQASYAITDTTRVLGGVRYTQDDRDWQIYGQDPNNRSTYSFTELVTSDGDGDWSEVTWKAGVEFDMSEDTMLYATVSTGFLAGNQQGAFNGTSSYDEQTVTAFELGSKSLLADGSVRLNASFYVNQYEDLLATRFVDAGATTLAFTDNAGEIDAMGLEVELDWAVTDQLQLGARMSMQQAEYGDFALPNVFQEGGTTIQGIANQFQLDGLQVQNSPDFTGTLLGSYLVDLGASGTLIPSVTLYYSSDYRVDDSNWFFGNQDAYTKTDLSVTWMSVNQDWTARLWVNNLEDEATLLKATRFGGDVAVTDYANPRMWGLTVGYRY